MNYYGIDSASFISKHRDEGWFSSSSSSLSSSSLSSSSLSSSSLSSSSLSSSSLSSSSLSSDSSYHSSIIFGSEDSWSSSDSEEPPEAANTKKRKRALPTPEVSASVKRARLESKVWNEDWGYGADFIQWQQRHSVDGATLDLTNTETTVAPKDKESDTEVIDLLE